jgi:type IV secretion system protein VirB4
MPDGTTRLRGAAAALPAAAARAIRRERTARDYLPYLGHAAPWAVLLEGGGLLGMLCLAGAAWEAADPAEVNGAHARLNVLLRNVASDRLVLLVHVVRTFADAREYPAGRFRSGFAAALDAAYRDRLLGRTLWRNHVFLSVLRRPPLPAGERVGSWLARRRGPAAEATAADLRALDETMQVLAADLAGYGAIRLGLRAANGIAFSEIGEALRLVLTGEALPVPLVNGHLGGAIHTDRVIVGREAIEMRGPAGSTYAAMFGLREYPATTWPGQFDAILAAPYRCVLTQGFGFLSKAAGQGVLTRKQNQMVSAQDKAASQRETLSEASDQLQSNAFVMGDHHLSLMVLADGLPELADAAAEARRDLADGGAVVVREDLGLEAAYWAQLPGNAHLRARPGVVSSRNFAAMAPLHSYPQGAASGQWGEPLALWLCCVFCILARRAPGFGMARQRLVQLRADLAFKGRQFTAEVILWAVRWYLMFPVSYRDLELMLQDRGVEVAHTTIFRWIQAYAPALEKRIRPHLRRSNGSWRVDETYVRVKGRWCYLYRAVDSRGQTIDFLLATRRDAAAAKRFFRKALRQPHTANPRTISVDKNPAYPRAVAEMKADGALWRFSRLRQSKYLNNIVEQDHRRVKRLVRPGLGFGSLRTARRTLAGYEAMAMIRKGQAHQVGGRDMRAQAAFVAKLFGLAA